MLCCDARGVRLQRGDDAGALSDLDQAVSLSGGATGEYFVQRARARARVAMRSNGREEALAGVQVLYVAPCLRRSEAMAGCSERFIAGFVWFRKRNCFTLEIITMPFFGVLSGELLYSLHSVRLLLTGRPHVRAGHREGDGTREQQP